jgi:hypothetical protein
MLSEPKTNEVTKNQSLYFLTILNFLVTLVGLITLFYFVKFNYEISSQTIKLLLFIVFISTTTLGFFYSIKTENKVQKKYFQLIVIIPILFILGLLVTGNGILGLHFGAKIIYSTFIPKEKLLIKESMFISKSLSLSTLQNYDLYKQQSWFEKKVATYCIGESFDYKDFKIIDSSGSKKLELTDMNDKKTIYVSL